MMLWKQCLHDWIWYFGHGCRQCRRSLGMCDHRALWPRGCTSSSLVWIRRHGPSRPWTSTPGPLCDKPQPTATHSQTGKWQPLGRLLTLRSPVKSGAFFLLLHLRGSRDCLRPESGRLCGLEHVMCMSISTSASVPLVMCGPEASDSCCHLLGSRRSSFQWHEWLVHQLQKEKCTQSQLFKTCNFFLLISLLMIWRWGEVFKLILNLYESYCK